MSHQISGHICRMDGRSQAWILGRQTRKKHWTIPVWEKANLAGGKVETVSRAPLSCAQCVSRVHQTGNAETTALNEADLSTTLRIWTLITQNQILFLLLTSDSFLLTNSCGPLLPPLCSTCDFTGTHSRRHSHMRVSYFDFRSVHRFRAEYLFVSLCPSLQNSDPTVFFAKKDRELAF